MHGHLHVVVAVIECNEDSNVLGRTMFTVGLPLLDIILCSSFSVAAEDRGGVDSMADLGLSRKNR